MTMIEAEVQNSGDAVLFDLGTRDPDPRSMDPQVTGAKAANLMRLAAQGLPIPPGFVFSTGWCTAYEAHPAKTMARIEQELPAALARLERMTGKGFGDRRRPLLVSVRSGAAQSMPGMMETILNLGLAPETIGGLVRMSGNPRFAQDSFRRLIAQFGEVVDGIAPGLFEDETGRLLKAKGLVQERDLDFAEREELTRRFLELYSERARRTFPADPLEQLRDGIEAVLKSWQSPRAQSYRKLNNLTGTGGTAVLVQAMVFGNLGPRSGAGVGFTRDPATGTKGLFADFLFDAQGEDVVSGRASAVDLDELAKRLPLAMGQLRDMSVLLEQTFRDMQDFEFTIEDGRLFLLQSRNAKRTPLAALVSAIDFVEQGVIDPGEAVDRLSDLDPEALWQDSLIAPDGTEKLASGTGASPGAAAGQICLSAEKVKSVREAGGRPLLLRPALETTDIEAIAAADGILSARGARTSHAAVVARQLGRPFVTACPDLTVDLDARVVTLGGRHFREEEWLTIDGGSGAVYAGRLEASGSRPDALLAKLEDWRKHAS